MSGWDFTTDALVVGSGGAGLSAALAARSRNLDVLVLEKSPYVGGSTGMSGGLVWIANNPFMRDDAEPETPEKALAYVAAVAGDVSAASSVARRAALIAEGSRMIEMWQGLGIALRRADGYPDYHSDAPGGSKRGRNLEALLFDIHELGQWEGKVQAGMFAGLGLVGYGTELAQMLYYNQSAKALLTAARVQTRTWVTRWRKKALVANGGALVGRMLRAALDLGAQIWTDSSVVDLIVENGRVAGVVAQKDNRTYRIAARHGVLLAAGGFSRNDGMRAQYGGNMARSAAWSMAHLGDTGEILEMAVAIGAATDLMDEAIWVPVMRLPDGTVPPYTAREMGAFSRARWRAGSILVDAAGQRFANESMSYRELGQMMFARNRETAAIPSWLIFDDRLRRRCLFGALPGRMPEQWIDSGFVTRRNTLHELAAACGIDADGLQSTVQRFNEFARTGIDADFHRGESAYDRYMGDPVRRANNCLATIARPPFYATAIYPGDVGTFGGLLTDEYSRSLDSSGRPIAGLYAAGNITAPVVGRGYLGAGGSIGPACTFGFIAMNHIADQAGAAGVAATGTAHY